MNPRIVVQKETLFGQISDFIIFLKFVIKSKVSTHTIVSLFLSTKSRKISILAGKIINGNREKNNPIRWCL